MNEPRASRPTSPAGYWNPRPIAWAWARERLIRARNYWVASVALNGAPHARPVWGAWVEGRHELLFDTGSRIGAHLDAQPAVTVHLESGDEVVILEGTAARVTDAGRIAEFLVAYNAKYSGSLTEPPGVVYAVRPQRAFAWLCDPENLDGGAVFASTGTRWDFDPPPA